jgi:predicted DNA-binding transcriptional regulator YafY
MLETSARLLGLLSLLQTRRSWTGPELAGRLEVGVRTIRRDVDKLRSLGYPVEAAPGVAGGYRLGAGADLPPLLLDDEEAIAVAVGLRTAAGGTVSGIEETSVRALAKLEQVLPSRLRRRVSALQAYTVPLMSGGPTVDADVLATIAAACRDHEGLRFSYEAHDGTAARRDVQPLRLVHLYGKWYLVAWDVVRDDWRTFRVDRMTSSLSHGKRFTPRSPPAPDMAAYVQKGVRATRSRYQARVILHAPIDEVRDRVPPWAGTLEPIDDERCELNASSDWLGGLAVYVAGIGVDFTVVEPEEFAEEVRRLADRFARAT